MNSAKELLELSASIKRHISLPTISALNETISIAKICILESNSNQEEVEVLDLRQNDIELQEPVTSSAIRPLQFQLHNDPIKQAAIKADLQSKPARSEEALRSVPIKCIAVNCEFAVSNSSSAISTIPTNIMANTCVSEKCSATFGAPSTTVNALVYAKLQRQRDAHASAQIVVRQPAILLCSSEACFFPIHLNHR